MSWQTYVDSNLVGSGKFVKAAILGQAGGVWAATPGYTVSNAAHYRARLPLTFIVPTICITPTSPSPCPAFKHNLTFLLSADEQKAVLNVFNDPASAQASGVRLAGQKFFTLQVNERSYYGKKAADGVVIVKTKQAVLVAEYAAPIQAPEATPVAEALADYLISVGY
ncbi:hypothetical protein EVG20_g3865 [Dentipellis fragilis]|uniref:Profilin n=1 Tax=Dentipellis fragilis TaxID=205917 RepID=A0A4Y9Z0X4_9AGAM|nr:hypothetical protein EVG20_g3865 [Dentipellis fragilis]